MRYTLIFLIGLICSLNSAAAQEVTALNAEHGDEVVGSELVADREDAFRARSPVQTLRFVRHFMVGNEGADDRFALWYAEPRKGSYVLESDLNELADFQKAVRAWTSYGDSAVYLEMNPLVRQWRIRLPFNRDGPSSPTNPGR
jgi:hypothetical protein